MKKRFLALLLAVCMLLPLVACGETAQGGGEEKTEATGDVVQDTLAAVNAAVKLKEGEEYNFESHLPLAKEGEDNHLMIGLVTSALTTDYDDNDYTKWLEEVTGIDLEFRQFTGTSAETATQISLMIASGETLPDILLRITGISKTDGDNYGRDGYFIDLSEYFKNPELNYYRKFALEERFNWFDDTANSNLMLREIDPETGAMYAYPRMENSPEDRPRSHVSINKAWLEAVGKKVPATIAELRDVLTAFRDQDPNGNGEKDEIPLAGRSGTVFTDVVSYLVNAYVYWHPTYHFNVTDGKLWAPYNTDEYRKALITIKGLVDDGLITEAVWTMNNAELKALQNPADGVYKVGVIGANRYSTIEAGSRAMHDYTELPPLADETGKGGYGPVDYYSMEYNTFITKDCKNPELAFKLLDFFCSSEAAIRSRWGVYGVDWTESDGKTLGNLGGVAKYKTLADDPQTYANAKTWHNYAGITCSLATQKEIDVSDPDAFITARYYRDLDCIKNYEKAGLPDEVFYYNVYTRAEADEREEFTNDLTAYIKKARDEFCAGIRDPENDADWEQYLNDLESLHYSRWIEIAQTAYDRTFNKK